MIPFAAKTHPGHRRSSNEDSFAADPELGLWIVADGLGGHSNGEIASTIACDVIKRDVAQGSSLVSAIEHAHREVLKEIHREDSPSDMGTTVVVLRLIDEDYEIAWVGDSRAYLFDGRLKQLTTDHSAINDLVQSGAIDSRQAKVHPQRHALSRSLGVSDKNESEAGFIKGTLETGQQILLCTDGLTDELSDAAILSELRINEGPESQVDAIVSGALANGGHDNLTVVLVGEARKPRKDTTRKEGKSGKSRNLETTQNIGEPARELSARKFRMDKNTVLLGAVILIVVILSFISGT